MPNIMKYFFDISFSQDDYIYNEFEDKLLFIFNKFVATNDSNITEGITGLCAALSAEYLTHVRQGRLEQGKHYLESIKVLTKILDEEIYSHTSPYLKANLQAKKLHAQEKINRLLIDLANRQRASFDMLDIASYEPAYWYWPKKESTETLANYIERVSEYENNVQILYKDRFWFKEFFLETALQVDNESYTTEEVKFFANNALIALKKKYLEKYINYYNQRGLKTINNSQKYILNEINFDEFIKTSIDIEDIDKNKYFEFCSEDHMMAIVIEKNRETRKLTYAFFDPNYGVIQTDNKYIFIQFLNYIVKIRDDIYRFPGFQNDTVNVFISEMEYDDLITEHVILPVIDENLVNITTNKILCESRDNFILDNKVKIIFKQFNDNNRTTTIELISEKNQLKNINIVVDTLEADEILALFTNQYENILQLSENNIHIRINNQNYEIRKITNISDIIYYLPNSRELLEFYLTVPIANFPCEQLPVKLFELYNNKVLGDKELEPLEQWWNPKISPELISQQKQTELTKSQLDGSNDSYNIIIQLEDEEIVNQAVVNLIGKHPTNTVLIQYDLATDQYRVIYGDMDKVAGKKTRWLLVGHGRLDKQSNQRLFANKNAYDIVDKLKKLKETLLVSNEPEKIVLLGCKLGKDNLLDNFALNISQQFWHKGFSATVVAYTKDLYINDSGRKQVYLDGEQHKQPAKYYKNRYIKDSASGEIMINGEALILSLLREINLADISLPKAVNRYRDYLNQYFYYPNGELDLDLLKTVAYDGEAYQIFIDNFTSDERISNNYDIGVLIDNLHKKNIYNVPLWSKINTANITAGSSQILNENGAQIIFRFSGDKIFRQQAELLAKQLPKNTFIFQVDKYSNTAIIEYGELNKLNNTEIKKWILLGDIVNYDEQSLFEGLLSAKLVDVLGEIKLFLGLNIPVEVCFFSQQGLGKLANPYDPSGMASETVINLARRAINSTVTTYQNESSSLLSLSSDELHQYNVLTHNPQKLSRFDYNIDTKQLYFNHIPIEQYLLMDIVTNKIDLNTNSHKYGYHLQGYLMDENDQLDINKINQIKYDPIINRKVNSYFEQNKYIGINALIEWRNLFLNNQLPTIQQQAYDIKILLENIAYRPQIIHYLSSYSNYLLSQLFFYPNGTINMAKIMMLIQDNTSLENLKISLMELASIDRRSSLSKLTLKQALVKSQQWHNHYLSNIISLANRIDKKSIPTFDITINPISHAFYYEKSNRLEKKLSLLYAYNENNTARLSELLQYHHSLLAFSNQRLLTDQDDAACDI